MASLYSTSSTLSERQACPDFYYSSGTFTGVQTAAPPVFLPKGIQVVNTGARITVSCSGAPIFKGTRFGPYLGKVVHPSRIEQGESNEFLWEVR